MKTFTLQKSVMYLLIFLFLLTSTAYAFRCGNGLVRIGDTKYEVISLCGEPVAKEFIGCTKKGLYGLKIIELIYGPIGGFYYYLTFVGNRLTKIESIRH